MDLIHHFDYGVYLAPERDCLVMDERRWSYRDAQRFTMRIASALVRDGLKEGSKVAVLSPNDPVAFMCVLGVIRAHMIWVPLNPRNSAENLIAILKSFECQLLIYDSTYESIATDARREIPSLTSTVCLNATTPSAPSLDLWLADAAETFATEPADRDAIVGLATTGGTTGLPKGVMQTHLYFEHFVASMIVMMPAITPPRFLAAAPMTHAAGIFSFHIFARGGTVFILPAAKPLMIAEAIQKYGITDTILPPTVIYGMLAEPTIRDYDYRSLRYFWYGTAPMSPDRVREAIEVFGPCMVSGWGQTEAIAGTFLRSEELVKDGKIISEKRLLSCGRKFPFTEVAAMSPDGKILGANEPGELVMRGVGVMKGYYNDPEATADAFRFGWHHTGDVGYFDEEGYCYIVDRVKDMIISGGFNIFPTEIERVLFSHSAVEDCAVIGVPDEKWGERVAAVVQLKPNTAVSAEELMALCREKLGGMKAPKQIEFRTELPRSPVGKTLKRAIRDEYWKGKARKV